MSIDPKIRKGIERAHRYSVRSPRQQRLVEQVLDRGLHYIKVLKQKILDLLGDEFDAFQFETLVWKFCAQRVPDELQNKKLYLASLKHASNMAKTMTAYVADYPDLARQLPLRNMSQQGYWIHTPHACSQGCHRSNCLLGACHCNEPLNTENLARYWKLKRTRRRNRLRGPYA